MSDVLDWGALLSVTIGGVDRTADLIGSGEIDRELDASGLATFSLARGSGKPTVGQAVEIAGVVDSRYVGIVSAVAYNPSTMAWDVECHDQLQAQFESQTSAPGVLALLPAGCIWHKDLFGEFADGWECAQDAMSTVPKSIYMSGGALQSVDWAGTGYTTTIAHSAGGIYDGSVELSEARERELIASIVATVEIRYSRWHHWWLDVSWAIPDWDFCDWLQITHSLPTREMIAEVVSGNVWALKSSSGLVSAGDGLGIATTGLPASGAVCGTVWNLLGGATQGGFLWNNEEFGTPQNAVIEAHWTCGRRWSQTMTEVYTLTVSGPSGTPGGTETERASHAAEAADDTWDQSSAARSPGVSPAWTWDAGSVHGYQDQVSASDRTAVLTGMRNLCMTRIRASHRRTTVSVTVEPGTEPALGERVRIQAEDIDTVGQVVQLVTSWDGESHQAGCAVVVAVTAGTTAADPSTVPTGPDMTPTGYTLEDQLQLGTHIGGLDADEPPQDDAWDGWVGMVQTGGSYPVAGSETYSQGFVLTTPDVPDEARDERTGTASASYEIATLRGTLTIL